MIPNHYTSLLRGGDLMAPRSVWVSWREARNRYEVGFFWEGRTYQFYSWSYQGRRFAFTKENKYIADEFAAHIRSLMRPNLDGIVIFEPAMVSGGKIKSLYRFPKYTRIWLEGYQQLADVNRKSQEYVDHLNRYARLYWLPYFKSIDIRQINKPLLKQFYLDLCGRNLSKKYVQNILDSLKSMLTEAFSEHRLQLPEFPDYKEKKHERKIIKWISESKQDDVLDCTPTLHRPIVRIIGYHGLRLYEARTLVQSDLELNSGVCHIRTAKGGPPRTILLDSEVIRDIRSIPRYLKHQFVFHHDGIPYTKTTLWKIMRKALDDAGFPHITPSQFGRHSHASHILQRGGSTRLAQDILGHSDIRTTERYTHTLVDDQEAVKRKSKGSVKGFSASKGGLSN